MTEAELQTAVTELAESLGLVVLHVRDVRRESKAWTGFPDLFIVGPAGVLFRELKSSGGHLRGEQRRWQWRLREAGQDAGIWQPRHWDDGTIATELTALNLPEGQAAAAVVSADRDPEQAFFRVLYGHRT